MFQFPLPFASLSPADPALFLPLIAAFAYAVGALLMKRASAFSVGVWRMTFLTNLVTFICFLPILGFGGNLPGWGYWWRPAVCAGLFILGQLFTFLAISRGDVSVATPMLGLKIILVALFAVLCKEEPISAPVWWAAGLSTLAVVLLNMGGGSHVRARLAYTAITSFLAAASFALFDVLVPLWVGDWGLGRFLPVMFGITALLSLGFVPLFPGPWREVPRGAWPWLASGSILIAVQASVFVSTLAVWGKSAESNVVYSSRGLFSVLLVWFLGSRLAREEHALGRTVLAWRLAGACTLLLAISLLGT